MKIHIVQKGDTLYKISKKYGVDFEQLKAMNSHLSNPDLIMPGMKIKVPTGKIPLNPMPGPSIPKLIDIKKEIPKPKEIIPPMPKPPLLEEVKVPHPPKLKEVPMEKLKVGFGPQMTQTVQMMPQTSQQVSFYQMQPHPQPQPQPQVFYPQVAYYPPPMQPIYYEEPKKKMESSSSSSSSTSSSFKMFPTHVHHEHMMESCEHEFEEMSSMWEMPMMPPMDCEPMPMCMPLCYPVESSCYMSPYAYPPIHSYPMMGYASNPGPSYPQAPTYGTYPMYQQPMTYPMTQPSMMYPMYQQPMTYPMYQQPMMYPMAQQPMYPMNIPMERDEQGISEDMQQPVMPDMRNEESDEGES